MTDPRVHLRLLPVDLLFQGASVHHPVIVFGVDVTAFLVHLLLIRGEKFSTRVSEDAGRHYLLLLGDLGVSNWVVAVRDLLSRKERVALTLISLRSESTGRICTHSLRFHFKVFHGHLKFIRLDG